MTESEPSPSVQSAVDPAALALRDSITLTGLRVRAHHGVFDFERENGQDFVIDATVWLDVAPAAGADALAETVHYGELAIALADAVTRDPVDLIETVAERLAAVALGFAAADVVRITVHKPDAPIPLPFDDVAVQITRARS
ncbi:dihydroneopterin aldolase [Rathayibacter sp. Leaf299]|uniref:dihydroneopterin aldolase n=1 Tax=Rathayibacter sp. Leaf299 TaxID=1736328 RepID=UPI0009EB188E|nr:dihydroneopterin aldolase [Rathayibacter sp. Leaf299]